MSIPRPASQIMKIFRTQQIEGLKNHLRLYGPLPTTSEVVASLSSDGSNSVTEPSIILPNPFIARKNPKTGKWRGPKYSLRRQADLVKKAKETDKLAIIPPGPKVFAMGLRMRRLQTALSQTESAILAAAQATFNQPNTNSDIDLATARPETEVESKLERERLWTNPYWVGDTKKKATKGEQLGIKLYAGKKKMFKGHSWEKERVKRLRRQSILMRDMKARIARYKSVSVIHIVFFFHGP